MNSICAEPYLLYKSRYEERDVELAVRLAVLLMLSIMKHFATSVLRALLMGEILLIHSSLAQSKCSSRKLTSFPI